MWGGPNLWRKNAAWGGVYKRGDEPKGKKERNSIEPFPELDIK